MLTIGLCLAATVVGLARGKWVALLVAWAVLAGATLALMQAYPRTNDLSLSLAASQVMAGAGGPLGGALGDATAGQAVADFQRSLNAAQALDLGVSWAFVGVFIVIASRPRRPKVFQPSGRPLR